MSSYEELEARFQRIKSLAKNMKQSAPPYYNGTAETTFDEEDVRVYKTMQTIFTKYLVTQMSFADATAEIEKLKLGYIRSKQINQRNAEINHKDEVKRRLVTDISKQLIHPEGLSYEEVFRLLFCKLIPSLTDDVTGSKIREGAGFFLLTAVGNLTEAEREELRKCYQ